MTFCVYTEAMLTRLLDLFFPLSSLTGVEGTWLTNDEKAELMHALSTIMIPASHLQKHGCTELDELRAVMEYNATPLLHCAIHTWKYRRIRAFDDMMTSLIASLSVPENLERDCVICPVPLHWSRTWDRGFNQADILAQQLSISWQREVVHLLTRTRATGHQAHRSKQERWSALTKAFSVKKECIIPAEVILVDDIFTTGATLQECAKTLKAAGVKSVRGVVLARG